MNARELLNIDFTLEEGHDSGWHKELKAWKCSKCAALSIKTEENISIKENLFNFKRWFNGIKKFSSVKLLPSPRN